MNLNNSPTELTTSATDAALALECIIIVACLWRAQPGSRFRTTLWCWVFCLLAFSSLLGVVVHGLELADTTRGAIWKPLYLSLGTLVALFMVGAVYDWYGRDVAGRLLPWAIGVGVVFFALTQLASGAFSVFVVYEAAALICALTVYCLLAATRRLAGAGVVATAIVLNLAAAGVQTSSVSATIIFPFDHNGIFHLVQIVGVATLGLGVRMGLRPEAQRLRSVVAAIP